MSALSFKRDRRTCSRRSTHAQRTGKTHTNPKEKVGPSGGKGRVADSEAVARFLAGDERAFEELYRRYAFRLRRFVAARIDDDERAQDVVQEVFMQVLRHLHNFDQSKTFSTWIFHITKNRVKNEFRRNSRRQTIPFSAFGETLDDDGDLPVEFADERYRPDRMAEQRDLREFVEEAAERLPDLYRESFKLSALEGKAYLEIAESVGLNVGTVKSRLHRGRAVFIQLIAPALV